MIPNRVFIYMEGGLIRGVLADRPDDLEIVIADYDVEGTPDDETQLNNFNERAVIRGEVAEDILVSPAWDYDKLFEEARLGGQQARLRSWLETRCR